MLFDFRQRWWEKGSCRWMCCHSCSERTEKSWRGSRGVLKHFEAEWRCLYRELLGQFPTQWLLSGQPMGSGSNHCLELELFVCVCVCVCVCWWCKRNRRERGKIGIWIVSPYTVYSFIWRSLTTRWSSDMYICWPLLSNQSFYRQITGCGMGVGDHRVAQWWKGVMGRQNSWKTLIGMHLTMYLKLSLATITCRQTHCH